MLAGRKFSGWVFVAVLALAVQVHAQRPVEDRLMMRMALILEYEDRVKKEADEDKRMNFEVMVRVLFREMVSDFHPQDMREYVLVRVGDYLRTKTNTPEKALVYYDEAMTRQDLVYRPYARWGRADVYSRSSDEKVVTKAIREYDQIARETEDPAKRELALFRKISLLVKVRAYAKAAAEVAIHLDHDQNCFGRYRPGVDLLHALTYDGRGMAEEALAMYSNVFSAHMGNMPVATIALTRWMELMWQRKRPGDRQAAYEAAVQFIGLSPRFKQKMTAEELRLLEDVKRRVQNYEADPEIRKVEGIGEIRRHKE